MFYPFNASRFGKILRMKSHRHPQVKCKKCILKKSFLVIGNKFWNEVNWLEVVTAASVNMLRALLPLSPSPSPQLSWSKMPWQRGLNLFPLPFLDLQASKSQIKNKWLATGIILILVRIYFKRTIFKKYFLSITC